MAFYVINPEVAGGWGEGTRFTRTVGQRTVIHVFDYEFDDWFGDELLTSISCYIVTQRLAADIARAGLSGIVFDDVMISKSETFEDLYPEGRELPKFLWMKVEGEAGRDDFGINSDLVLVVSDRALAVLKSGQLDNAIVEPLTTTAR